MKPDIHPDYQKVLFVDTATGDEWVSRSTMKASKANVAMTVVVSIRASN